MGGFGGVVNSERRDVASSYSGGSETSLAGKCIALRVRHNIALRVRHNNNSTTQHGNTLTKSH